MTLLQQMKAKIAELSALVSAYEQKEEKQRTKPLEAVELPKNVRAYKGTYQGRKMVRGRAVTAYAQNPEMCKTILDARAKEADTKNYTFKAWFDVWLDKYVAVNATASWLSNLKTFCKHLEPIWKTPLTLLTSVDLQDVVSSITLGNTRQQVLGLLRRCLKKAFFCGYIEKEIYIGVEVKGHTKIMREAIEDIDLQKMMPHILADLYGQYLLFFLFTGIRPKEFLSLHKYHFDFVKGQFQIPGTKTKSANRMLPIPSRFLCLADVDFDRYCPHTAKTLNKHIERICQAAGVEKYTLYNFRHTCATLLYENQIPDKLITSWLGHTNIEFTKSHYVSVRDNFAAEYGQKFDNIMQNIVTPKTSE